MSGERLQDHWSSGFYRTTDNEGRNHRGVVVKLLALETRGLGFEPLLLQSFGCDFKPMSNYTFQGQTLYKL